MLVDAMLDRQLTTIISSHNLKEINEVCDTAALLHNGKIIFCRDIDDVKGSVHKIQVVFSKNEDGSVAAYSKEDFAQDGIEILHYEQSQSICFIIAKGDIEAIKASLLTKRPMLTEVIPLTLEEIFIYELEVLGYDSSDKITD
jgi:ABC-2 type transport system ATP-binding protein